MAVKLYFDGANWISSRKYDNWERVIPIGYHQLYINGDIISIVGLNKSVEDLFIDVLVTDIEKDSVGTKYTSVADFQLATNPFFSGGVAVSIVASNGKISSPITPIQTSLDIIYENDIDWDASDFTGWEGEPRDLFGNVNNGGIYNNSIDNPKVFTLKLIRTRQARTFAIGTSIGNFSNLKVSFLGSGDQIRGEFDASADPRKSTSAVYSEEEYTFNAIRIEFLTADRVDCTNIFIQHVESSKKQDYVLKWGINPDVDNGDIETVWSLGDQYIFTTTPQNYYISSSSTSDITQTINVEILFINSEGSYQKEVVSVSLNGRNKVLIPTSGLCVASNRAYNDSSTPLAGDVYIYEDEALSGGIPDDLSKVRSFIGQGREQTEQAVYTVPEYLENGRKVLEAEIYSWNGAALRNRTTTGAFGLYVAQKGKVPRIQGADAVSEDSKSGEVFGYDTPLKVPAGSDVYLNVEDLTVSNVKIKAGFIIKLIVL